MQERVSPRYESEQIHHYPPSALSTLILSLKWLRLSGSIILFDTNWVKQTGFVFYSQGGLVCVFSYILSQLLVVDQLLRKCSSPVNSPMEVAVLYGKGAQTQFWGGLLRLGLLQVTWSQPSESSAKGRAWADLYSQWLTVRFNVVPLFCWFLSSCSGFKQGHSYLTKSMDEQLGLHLIEPVFVIIEGHIPEQLQKKGISDN